ncbi:hypothetical protein PT974_04653 [Cladobotryum mycophilum]|uniref:Uncharacterized protein n=1 Tax=Cladobotryum mycophilum TaxID=491253 RepID=A0ABR0SVL9_9HYPO
MGRILGMLIYSQRLTATVSVKQFRKSQGIGFHSPSIKTPEATIRKVMNDKRISNRSYVEAVVAIRKKPLCPQNLQQYHRQPASFLDCFHSTTTEPNADKMKYIPLEQSVDLMNMETPWLLSWTNTNRSIARNNALEYSQRDILDDLNPPLEYSELFTLEHALGDLNLDKQWPEDATVTILSITHEDVKPAQIYTWKMDQENPILLDGDSGASLSCSSATRNFGFCTSLLRQDSATRSDGQSPLCAISGADKGLLASLLLWMSRIGADKKGNRQAEINTHSCRSDFEMDRTASIDSGLLESEYKLFSTAAIPINPTSDCSHQLVGEEGALRHDAKTSGHCLACCLDMTGSQESELETAEKEPLATGTQEDDLESLEPFVDDDTFGHPTSELFDDAGIPDQDDFQKNNAHQYWKWDDQAQNWWHWDEDSRAAVWAPLEFD